MMLKEKLLGGKMVQKRRTLLRRFSLDALIEQFTEIIDLLNELGTPYHLEGGTLLGIVRDNNLLPWDDDTDLSINMEHLGEFHEAHKAIKALGWRTKLRYFKEDTPFSKAGDIRVLKISDYWLANLKGLIRMDIFLKYPTEEYFCWSAADRYMRVNKEYYTGFDIISWNGRDLRVPKNYKAYLTEKFGNWAIPNKSWSAKGEGTVFGSPSHIKGPIMINQSKGS